METHPPQDPVTDPVPAPTATVSRKVVVRRWLIGLAAVGVIGWTCSAVSDYFENLQGGPVRSAADYRKQDIKTREAGRRAVGELRPGAADANLESEEDSTSCADDLGYDRDGVTREQPRYEWDLRYSGKADYLADLGKLRTTWEHRGWKTHDIPPPETTNRERPLPDWPGIRTTDDDGIAIRVSVDWYSGKPTLSTDGGCIRYDRDDKVTARKRTGAADAKRPGGREGTITYDDGVQVSIGPVQPVTPTRQMTGDAPPAAHTYRVIITVTNRSGAPVELESHDIGSYEGANPGIKWPTGYPAELHGASPNKVAEGASTRLEFVFTTGQAKPAHLQITYGPGDLHTHYPWLLSIP
ncbi:hypothetical protein ACH4U6_30815 [Streptomyces netropsis]|uniref:hypothetical protein n=1 Tax=Streptomyces netropsis TaxID=55404 RepID=UPI00378884F1